MIETGRHNLKIKMDKVRDFVSDFDQKGELERAAGAIKAVKDMARDALFQEPGGLPELPPQNTIQRLWGSVRNSWLFSRF